MKYNEDTNINIISIGEKIEYYLKELVGRCIDEGDEDQIITITTPSELNYSYTLLFNDTTTLSIDKSRFNPREQKYIENTQDKIQFTIGRKVEEC